MIPAAYLEQTFCRFPAFNKKGLVVEPIEKGGSGRSYYRLSAPGIDPVILVKYTEQRAENRYFCDIAEFLHEVGVAVPRILSHDPAEGLIWVEDLGNIDLWHYRKNPWSERRPLYQSALAQVLHLHIHGHKAPNHPTFQQSFDADLYRWEQNYFLENCVGRHFGFPAEEVEQCYPSLRSRLHTIAEYLASLPRVLVHRDFQSQNIMIRKGQAWLIDFQGMRPGLAQYDVASLLYDPYVQLPAEERNILLNDYVALAAAAGHPVRSDFYQVYDLCALQRLMQALGAYGFLGYEKGLRSFLQHIPAALGSLHEVACRIPKLEPLVTLIERCRHRLA